MTYIEVFVCLQILDFITTLMALRMGGVELSPFIRWLMQSSPLTGLTAAKLLGFALGGYCLWSQRIRVLVRINYFFAGLVMWNLCNIFFALVPLR